MLLEQLKKITDPVRPPRSGLSRVTVILNIRRKL